MSAVLELALGLGIYIRTAFPNFVDGKAAAPRHASVPRNRRMESESVLP